MKPISNHIVLVSAENFESAESQVEDFFDNTMLVRYDRIEILKEKSFQATAPPFAEALQEALDINRKTLDKFIGEFEKTGFTTSKDFSSVECGYPSKLLHIITHFLDGFISIDSNFFNLVDDSHWLTEETSKEIDKRPENYWLIQLNCFSETPDKVSLVQA